VIALRAFIAIIVRWEVQNQLDASPRQQHTRYVCTAGVLPAPYEVERDTEHAFGTSRSGVSVGPVKVARGRYGQVPISHSFACISTLLQSTPSPISHIIRAALVRTHSHLLIKPLMNHFNNMSLPHRRVRYKRVYNKRMAKQQWWWVSGICICRYNASQPLILSLVVAKY